MKLIMNPKHPIQPIVTDEHGTKRFKANKIVQHLLYNGGINLNQLACLDFSREDHEQFAQLIGYSVSGAGDLSYFSKETYDAAQKMVETGESAEQAQITVLSQTLKELKDSIREPVANLFGVHPDDLR